MLAVKKSVISLTVCMDVLQYCERPLIFQMMIDELMFAYRFYGIQCLIPPPLTVSFDTYQFIIFSKKRGVEKSRAHQRRRMTPQKDLHQYFNLMRIANNGRNILPKVGLFDLFGCLPNNGHNFGPLLSLLLLLLCACGNGLL